MHANKFVESYFDAWNHHDPKGVADHLAEDGVYRDVPEIDITDYYDVPDVSRPHLARLVSRQAHENKYAKSGLNEEQMLKYKTRLENIMVSDQLYLQPDVTLPKLAVVVGCSVNHLSQVINSGFDMSFFDFMNQHRVAHAQEMLSGLDGQTGAILNIAFAVGFNSNSAFYAAFKKCVGQTPAQYRRTRNQINS